MPDKLQLKPEERERFDMLKRAVDDGIVVCVAVGWALREIKERKFYLAEGYATFEAFCDANWGWTKRHCNQLILDAKVINALPESLRKLITSGSAAKELAKLPESLRVEVLRQAGTAVPGKPVTAAAIKKVVSPPPRKSKSSPPPRKPASKAKVAPKNPVDVTGCEIPSAILPLWNRGHEAQELIVYASSMLGVLRKRQSENDPLFSSFDFTDTLAKLEQVRENLREAKPYAVCPTCGGKTTEGCLACKGRGFVSEFYWNTCVPQELKAMRMNKAQ